MLRAADRSAGGWVFTCRDVELFVPMSVPSNKAERLAEDFCQRRGWPPPSAQRFVLPQSVTEAKTQRRRYLGRSKPRGAA